MSRETADSILDRRRLWLGTAIAFLLSIGLALTVVLPAERGFDPLGTGAALGVVPPVPTRVHEASTSAWVTDAVVFELAPFESLEYKYVMEAGTSMVYGWRASGEVLFEFHGDLDGAPPEASERYQLGRGQDARGRFTAPGNGVHGWYWQNRGFAEVRLELWASGFMRSAKAYDRTGEREVALSAAGPEP